MLKTRKSLPLLLLSQSLLLGTSSLPEPLYRCFHLSNHLQVEVEHNHQATVLGSELISIHASELPLEQKLSLYLKAGCSCLARGQGGRAERYFKEVRTLCEQHFSLSQDATIQASIEALHSIGEQVPAIYASALYNHSCTATIRVAG